MRLRSVQIQNFRSIEDSTVFEIGDITCLVGKNEAGKSAALQALHLLRPYGKVDPGYDQTRDYPRRFAADFKARHPDGMAIVATTKWVVEQGDKDELAKDFGPDFLTGNEVTILRGYGYGSAEWGIPRDERAAVVHLAGVFELDSGERTVLEGVKTGGEAFKALTGATQRTDRQNKLLEHLKTYPDGNILERAVAILSSRTPTLVLFSHFDRMSGEVSVNKLIGEKGKIADTGDQIFLDFLDYAKTSLEELRDSTKFEDLKAKCEAASNRITDQIFEYWTQNTALEVEVNLSEGRPADPAPFNSGPIVRARVRNTLHRASVPFSERSAGFIWFFSFLVQFTQIRQARGNVIILLDEPGLTLHGRAQQDLLRYFNEKLKPYHQVIYSAHSPFMVPPDNFSSVKIVEDVVEHPKQGRPIVRGTKIRGDVLVTDKDSLFPLQGALGFDITQTLFVGKHTLLVEGPSDILYLQALSEALKQRKKVGLDPRWTLCPTGGIDKVQPFVSLFGGNLLHVAVLADQGVGDKRKIEQLRRSEILKAGHFFTAAEFTLKDESDIEDFFEPELFIEIVNRAYALPPANILSVAKLAEAEPSTSRQVKKAEALFRLMPEAIPMYDHFTPASWLIRNPHVLDGDTPAVSITLERAAAAFNALNALL
ncbi:MAG: ATP-dependent nuclease [Xanthobacteraceae bacterium]